MTALLIVLGIVYGLITAALVRRDLEVVILLVGLVLLCTGSYRGLFVTPPEVHMADVQRIFFIHVPTAWNALLVATGAFVLAIGALLNRRRGWDAAMEASVEVALVLTVMLCIQGAIWARPTWGAWWTWDYRLTTSAIMGVALAGVLSLRSFLEQYDRRVAWTAVATIIAYVDVPIVYMSVKWWGGMHQMQSTPATVSSTYHFPLRVNAFAILMIATWLVIRRARLALARDARRADHNPPESTGAELIAGVE